MEQFLTLKRGGGGVLQVNRKLTAVGKSMKWLLDIEGAIVHV